MSISPIGAPNRAPQPTKEREAVSTQPEAKVVGVRRAVVSTPGRKCASEACKDLDLVIGQVYARVLWDDGLIEQFHASCYRYEFGEPLRKKRYSVEQLEAMLRAARKRERHGE